MRRSRPQGLHLRCRPRGRFLGRLHVRGPHDHLRGIDDGDGAFRFQVVETDAIERRRVRVARLMTHETDGALRLVGLVKDRIVIDLRKPAPARSGFAAALASMRVRTVASVSVLSPTGCVAAAALSAAPSEYISRLHAATSVAANGSLQRSRAPSSTVRRRQPACYSPVNQARLRHSCGVWAASAAAMTEIHPVSVRSRPPRRSPPRVPASARRPERECSRAGGTSRR